MRSFYQENNACVHEERDKGEWSKVEMALQQGCRMLPWLINLFMNGMIGERQVMVLGEDGSVAGMCDITMTI